jgi:peptide/nickel transport system substrate-binding protein
MQNRFGIKDFFMFLLVGAVLVSVWLTSVQIDRQWKEIKLVQDNLKDVQERLAIGVQFSNATTQGTNQFGDPEKDPFSRIEAAKKMKGYAHGDWLIWAQNGGVAKITPLLSADESAYQIQGEVLESLGTRDLDTLDWKPLLAKSWKISDDGLKITFQLREGLHFSDGHPLTADDVVFTYDFIMDPKVNAPRDKSYLDRVSKVVKGGPLEVTFVFREPYCYALGIAAGWPILARHFYSQFKPEDFNNSVGYLLGSGPYKMEDPTSWKPGNQIQLIRNDKYWGVPPAFNRIVFKPITNDKARLAAFRNGDLDFLWASADQYHEMLQDSSLMSRTTHLNFDDPVGGYRYVGWNEQRDGKPTFFADKRVRQAMTMLLDRQQMVQDIMYGYATIASGPFAPTSKQYDPGVKPLPYDVAKAKQLLTEAGFILDANEGVLKNRDGAPFKFKLTYPSGSSNYDRMVLLMKDSYAKVGIILEPNPLEWGSFTGMLEKRSFDAVTLAWGAALDEDPYQIFDSKQTITNGDDFVMYKSPEADVLIETARRTIDENKRNVLWHQLHKVLNDDQPYTFLFFPQSMRVFDGRIQNEMVTRAGLNDPAEWFVPARLQKYRQ